jgi:gliding motility-associated-like protein
MKQELRRIIRKTALILSVLFTVIHGITGGNEPCSATYLDTDFGNVSWFDNSAFSDSGIDAPPYGGYSGADIWFSFDMPSSGFINLIVGAGTMSDPALAIYAGPCDDPKLLYNILDDNCTDDATPAVVLDELTPGENYYIRVWAQDGSGNGSFSLLLSQTTENQPGFILYADASEFGDCIMLTDNINTQHGCAWFEIPIDFSQPFVHEMTANFGDQDLSGADGICLIYQANGPDYCGASGGGIGALGMPNSAIFEFDTYQNGQYSDPSEDHASFNINGDMNHLNSIEGPVTLGNIEDGLDHNITFHYDGSGGYELYFDGVLILSGNYDFITHCFNGSSSVWWGYTAATGALNNEQIICPDTESIELGTQEYVEQFICFGESYNGYSETGFYVSYEPGTGNCLHQVNLNLTVWEENETGAIDTFICAGDFFEWHGNYFDIPGTYPLTTQDENGCDSSIILTLTQVEPEPGYLEKWICEEGYVEVEGQWFNAPGFYEVYTESIFGCDSIIFLDLFEPELEVEIIDTGTLTCSETQLELQLELNSFPGYDHVDFHWETPGGDQYGWSCMATAPGIYSVTAFFTIDDQYCEMSDTVFIEQDITPPLINGLENLFIDCKTIDIHTQLSPEITPSNSQIIWFMDSIQISTTSTAPISGPGTYVIHARDPENGCLTVDSAYVAFSIDFPDIEITGGELDCQTDTLQLFVELTGEIDSMEWSYENLFFSNDTMPFITHPGTYQLTVVSTDGCISKDSVHIKQDTIPPWVETSDLIMGCDSVEIQLDMVTQPGMEVIWNGPSPINQAGARPVVQDTGWYHYVVTNPLNHCNVRDSIHVGSLGNTPVIQLEAPDISCYSPEIEIELTSDQSQISTFWYMHHLLIDSTLDLTISEPGDYYVEVFSDSGCMVRDSIRIRENVVYPEIYLYADTLNCDMPEAWIKAETQFADSLFWEGPGVFTWNDSTFLSDVPGLYILHALNLSNGCSTIDSVELIDLTDYPEFTIQNDTLNCHRPQVALKLDLASIIGSVHWTFPDGSFSNDPNPIISQGGEYLLHLEVDGPCDIDTSLWIAEDLAAPVFSLTADTIDCNNQTAILKVFDKHPDDPLISITDPEGNIFPDSLLTCDLPGIYVVTVTGENGCFLTDSIEIRAFLEKPAVELYNTGPITCDNPVIRLISVSDDANLSYIWEGPDVSMTDTPDLEIGTGGDYTLIVTNEYGCRDTLHSMVAKHTDPPPIDISGNPIDCYVPSALLHFSSPDSIRELAWHDDAGTKISSLKSLEVFSGGWYYLEAINEFGCSNTDSLFIDSNTDNPWIRLLSENPLEVKTYEDPREKMIIEVESTGHYSINWSPQTGLSCYDCPDPNVVGADTDLYQVEVINEYGCISSLEIAIRYRDKLFVAVPNVFTPHVKDGVNDYFTLFSNSNVEIINELRIFDRWGSLVFLKSGFPPNMPELGWDGSYRGKEAMKGVYVYHFTITTIYGETLHYSGDITIL